MRNFMAAVAKVWNLPFVKYAIITIVGIVLVGFVGENSLLAHLRNMHYIGTLNDEIKVYNERYQNDMHKIRELNLDPKAMERIARERYFMKHDDEDIFVLSDDDKREPESPSTTTTEDETAE